MGRAAKTIIDGLKAAKIPPATQTRLKDLIDEAHDWDEAQTSRIDEVVRYVAGVPGVAKPVPAKPELEHCVGELMNALSKVSRTLDEIDLRALDVIVQGESMYWFWELESWVRDRASAFPAEPMLEETLTVLRARGLWKKDDDVLQAMFGHLNGFVTDDGELTSTGRWMLAKLDADAKAVFAVGRKREGGKRVSRLYTLLLAHRPALFEALVASLDLKEDSQKSYLAEVMIEADAAKFEARAVALMKGLKAPLPALLSARNLEMHFEGKYPELVKALLLEAIKGKDATFIDGDGTGSTRMGAIELAWDAFGEEAIALWEAYSEKNDALRLAFFALIEERAKEKVLPLLVDGLLYPKDPNATYGGVTHPIYVARMVELLKKHELSDADRARIKKKFGSHTNKKIKQEINALLAGPAAKKAPKKAAPAFDAKHGYRFEEYAAAIVKSALAEAKKALKKLPSPIQKLKLTGEPGHVQLNTLVIEGVGAPVQLELDPGKTKVPTHLDDLDDDVLPRWMKANAIDEGVAGLPGWGDLYDLPWCVLVKEQIAAVHEIAAGLKKLGCKLAKDCALGVGEHDSFWEERDGFDRKVRTGFAALAEDQQPSFAAVCFANPKKQRALSAREANDE